MRSVIFIIPLLVLFVVGASVTSVRSSAKSPKVLNTSLFGSTPGVVIRRVASDAAPWTVQEARVSIDQSGHFRVHVRGLLVAAGVLGSGDPVPPDIIGTKE